MSYFCQLSASHSRQTWQKVRATVLRANLNVTIPLPENCISYRHSCTKLHDIISQKIILLLLRRCCEFFRWFELHRILNLVCHFYERLCDDIFQASVLKIKALGSSVSVYVISVLRSGTVLSRKHNSVTFNTLRTGLLNCLNARSRDLTFRHRASCI